MTAQPGFEQLLGMLGAMSSELTGKHGQAVRKHVERLAQILAADGPEAEQRARAAAELEQLVGAIGELAGAPGAATEAAARGLSLEQLAGGLRSFAAYLRAPSPAGEAQVGELVERLAAQVAPPRPVPLDELHLDGTIDALAIESARRHGLDGAEATRAVERMRRQMAGLVRQLELRAQQEAGRARTAADAERLIDAVIQTETPLGEALAKERAPIVRAFRTVDLAHMADGLRVFGEWLATPADDPAAHVAQLGTQLAEALGPPTSGDPARGEAERRADREREIRAAVDEIFRATRPA